MSNIDINTFNYANSLIFLNTYSFYIKCIEGKNTHYFIFSLKENGFVNNYGLNNKLLINSNNSERKSKTYVDIYLEDNNKTIFEGHSYSILNDTKGVGDIFLDSSDKKPAKFIIELNEYEIPFYTLEIDSESSEYFSHIGQDNGPSGHAKLPDGSDYECKFNDALVDLFKLREEKQALNSLQGIKDTVKTPENTEHLFYLLQAQKKIFDCLYKNIKDLKGIPENDLNEVRKTIDFMKDTNNFILDNKEYNTESNDKFRSEIITANYLYNNISRTLEKIIKNVLPPSVQPTSVVDNPDTVPPVVEEVSLTPPAQKEVSSPPSNELESKLQNLENDVKTKYDSLKDSGFVSSDLLLQLLNAENIFLDFFVLNKKNINSEYRKKIKTEIVNPEFMILKSSDKRLESMKVSSLESKIDALFQEIQRHLGKIPGILKKGGGKSIIPVNVELSKENDLDFNSFLEKTIYIKPDKRLMYTSVSGSNKIPIVGYFTIGKNLLLKMIKIIDYSLF